MFNTLVHSFWFPFLLGGYVTGMFLSFVYILYGEPFGPRIFQTLFWFIPPLFDIYDIISCVLYDIKEEVKVRKEKTS